jgi:hypothetical protein
MRNRTASAALALLATAIVFISFSCDGRKNSSGTYYAEIRRAENPASGEDRGGQAPARAEGPRLPPREGETLLGVMSADIDADPEDEQILIVKGLESSSSYIGIVVLNQEGQRSAWVRVWEETTLATKYPTFDVSVKDMTGTREKDLVCTGMNDLDRHTILVLHPDRQGGPGVPAYSRIAAIEAESIDIVETERSPAYAGSLTDEAPWDILSQEQDLSSKNFMDKVETSWVYSPASLSYAPAGKRQISGRAIEQGIVDRYLNGDAATFERFLAGIWYMESLPPPGQPGGRVVEFSPDSGDIVFSEEGDVPSLGVFAWENSESTKRGLYISSSHQEIRLKRFIDIELVGPETIALKSFDNVRFSADSQNPWNGVYRKYSFKDVFPSPGVAARKGGIAAGSFAGEDGSILEFSYPRYAWSGRDADSGVFSSYFLGKDEILVLKSVKASGVMTRTRSFVLEREGRNGALSAIVLKPAEIGIDGVEYIDADPLRFRAR